MSTTVDEAGARRPGISVTDGPPPGAQYSPKIPPLIRRNTILLALTQAFVGMGNQTTPTLAPIIVVQMLGSAALSGLGSSILGVSRLIIAYPVGWLTDRYGRKAGLQLGLALTLVGTLVIGAAMLLGSFPLVVLGLVVFGLGVGAGQQLRLAAADMFVPARRGEGLGYVLTGSLIGAVAAPILIWGSELIAGASGQDRLATVWFLLPIIIVPSMVLVLLVRPDPKTIAQNLERYYPGYVAHESERPAVAEGGGLGVWLRHFPLATAFANSFAALGTMSMMMAMTALALDHHGYGLSLISVSVSLHVVGMFGFSIPFGRLSDRFGRRNVMLIGNVVIAVGSIFVGTSADYLLITIGTFLVGVGWSCVNVASSALITEVVGPTERGRAIGLSDTISQSSTILLPLAGGPLVAWAGLPILAVVSIAVLAGPVIMLARLREPSPGRYAHDAEADATV
ncbi:MAG TPA: MFS transporter [Chloroflexota bacterium]|nr:MFS transporter [Chloroflexota bacterium]